MSSLVTGANGFLGSAVAHRLVVGGERDLRCLVRPGSDTTRLSGLGVEVVRGNLVRADDCARAIGGVDTVYHLAAATSGPAADQVLNSAVATRNLLAAIVEAARGIKLVHCSSFGVYGVAGVGPGGVVDESTTLEPHPERRDVYSYAKLRQEQLVWQYHRECGVPVVVLRPGVVYGPGGGAAMSNRVGLRVFGVLLHLGRRNPIPITFVDNCAEAFVVAGRHPAAVGESYSVVDDDLVTAHEFLRRYRREVERVATISLPWFATRLMTSALEWYVNRSKGQLPDIFTQYKVASSWQRHRFDNSKLKKLGWKPIVTTEAGLRRHFEYLASHRLTGA